MKRLCQIRKAITHLIFAALIACIPTAKSSAQSIVYKDVGKSSEDRFGISAGGGYTFSHTDFKWTKTVPSPVFNVGLHYFSLEFLAVNLDFQKGLLKGGASLDDADNKTTGFENNFFAATLTFHFFPIALAGDDIEEDGILKVISTLYGGTGVGFLFSNVDANNISNAVYGAKPDLNANNLFIPLDLGVNFPVARIGREGRLMVNVNFRTNLCFSDKIDGYEPTIEANHHNDAYSTLTGGLVYKFGF